MNTKQHFLRDKSFAFAIRIVNSYKHLSATKKEYVISKQLLRCGTSVGANIHESAFGESRADYTHKLNIALKEASESLYWLKLLNQTHYLNEEEFKSIAHDCDELIALLVSSIKSLKQKE